MSEKQKLYTRIVALKHYSSNAFCDDVKRYLEIAREIEVLVEELKEPKTVGEYFKMMTKNDV